MRIPMTDNTSHIVFRKSGAMNYIGPSMDSILQSGDAVKIIHCENRKIKSGDVVVFYVSEQEKHIVHRVISIDSKGIRTRGDNNPCEDPWILQLDDIIGQVISVRRKNRDITIHGGIRGILIAWKYRTIRHFKLIISRLLHPVYQWLIQSRLVQSGIFTNLLPCPVRPRVFCFQRPNGTEMQILMGQWLVGRRFPGQNQWRIRSPFRIFINESTLPRK